MRISQYYGWALDAVLVKSVRTPAGPRLKHIAYLGTIKWGRFHRPFNRGPFWESVNKNLAKIEMTSKERRTIVRELVKTVPKPRKPQPRMEDLMLKLQAFKEKVRRLPETGGDPPADR
jgi:hypothetical protein